MHNFYLYIQKEVRKKKCFLHSYSILLLIHSQIFDFNVNIQFCYLLYIVIYCFQFFFFFLAFLVHVIMPKIYKSILLFRNPKYIIILIESIAYHREMPGTNHFVSCTQHTKQNKQRNKNF